jgi:alpha-tubulin suppressor-like RCC1 family protein
VTAVAAGDYHSLALRRDGTVVAWGNNDNGQLNVPVGLRQVKAIAAGENFSIALQRDGTLVTWGWSAGTVQHRNLVAIHAAHMTAVGLLRDGTLVQWTSTGAQRRLPFSRVVSVAVGAYHGLVLRRRP